MAYGAKGKQEKVKIAVAFKYLSNFWRSSEIFLINCEVELSLSWIQNCVFSAGENIGNAGAVANAETALTFKIKDAKLCLFVFPL